MWSDKKKKPSPWAARNEKVEKANDSEKVKRWRIGGYVAGKWVTHDVKGTRADAHDKLSELKDLGLKGGVINKLGF